VNNKEEIVQAEDEETEVQVQVEVDKTGFEWYFLQVLSGSEDKILRRLEKFIKMEKLEEEIINIIIPEYEAEKQVDREKKVVKQKLYPGYLLVQMRILPEIWAKIRGIDGVIDFVGTKYNHTPYPLTQIEKADVFSSEKRDKAKKAKVKFEKNEKVKVIDGPFANFLGVVEDIFAERRHLRVMISIFGRPTPVELSFDQVDKL
jgi:transcriptional antiterminator NusG